MGFTITPPGEGNWITISDNFIKNYMPSANGNYVKVYLMLQMVCQHHAPEPDCTISSFADRMECTENDILRALRYWAKEGLISLTETDGEIQSIGVLTPPADSSKESSALIRPASVTKPVPLTQPDSLKEEIAATKELPVPDKQVYTPLQAEAFLKDEEINRAITAVEQLLGTPVSQSHLELILYFMCDIGFSAELLITLYETAVTKGKKKPNYIEAIGISWAKQGITTPEEARAESAAFSGRYALVSRSLGISRNLAPAERAIIDTWNEYQFADSIIEEACKRTVLQTGDTNLHYVSKILSDWHRKQVISLDDIKKCDDAYQNRKRNSTGRTTSGSRSNHFQNFPQRTYSQDDYSSLEQKLLQGQKA